MKKTVVIVMALLLSACANMTPAQKTAAWVVGGVVVTAIVISASDPAPPDPACKLQTCGSGDNIFFCCR